MKKIFLGIILSYCLLLQAQQIMFTSRLNCQWHAFDSIVITNISRHNYSTTLYYPDTILYLSNPPNHPEPPTPPEPPIGIEKYTVDENGNIQVYPNPFSNIAQVNINLLQAENTILTLYDILGRRITRHQQYLNAGLHNFAVTSCPNGYYLLQIVSSKRMTFAKLLSRGNDQYSTPVIDYMGMSEQNNVDNSARKLYDPDFPFETGNDLILTAYYKDDSIEDYICPREVTEVIECVFPFYDFSILTELPIQNAYSDSMKYLGGNCPDESVVLINNQQDLENVFGPQADEMFTIDFSTHSLIHVRGHSGSTPAEIEKQLGKDSFNRYVMKIFVWAFQTFPLPWSVTIITEKIPDNSDFCLSIFYN
jgi:hypothetical protein